VAPTDPDAERDGSATGAGDTRPPSAGRSERFALAAAGVPFRLKLVVVWATIFVALGAFFAVARFDTAWMVDRFSFILGGLRYTLIIAVFGIALAVILALLGALGRLSRNPVAFGISGFYTSFFRGTPLIVQMFLIYLALPQVAINLRDQFPGIPARFQEILTLQAAVAGIVALGFNYGAYMTEIFRAGIQAVGPGQSEAAEALGMSYRQKMQRIVLPQAFRIIIPPTGNEFIAMMKDTALVSFLGASAETAELFRRAQLVGKASFKNLEAYLVAAALYWALTAVFTAFQRRLEKRLSKGYTRHVEGIPH
jgi:polar amino acid transport system permease protein